MDGSRLKITGAWTKAGIASCVHVQGSQRHENILFDCGFMNSDTTYAKYVFISHGHIDHVGSCISHARAKSLSGSLAVYYVPHAIVQHLTDAKNAFEKLDDTTIPMNIIGVGSGDEVSISPTLKVNVFATLHRVPSLGYAISSIRKGELLPELRGLTGEEIKELRMMGQTIHGPETEEIEMVYTGDTTMEGLLQLGADSRLFHSHTFITEVTYLDGDRSKAAQYGHVHIQDIVENAHLFRNVTYLVIVHISQKYSVSRVVKLMRDLLPPALLPKILVSLHSFGAREHLTKLVDERWEQQQSNTAGWGWSNHKAQRNYQQYAQSASNNSGANGNTNSANSGGGMNTSSGSGSVDHYGVGHYSKFSGAKSNAAEAEVTAAMANLSAASRSNSATALNTVDDSAVKGVGSGGMLYSEVVVLSSSDDQAGGTGNIVNNTSGLSAGSVGAGSVGVHGGARSSSGGSKHKQHSRHKSHTNTSGGSGKHNSGVATSSAGNKGSGHSWHNKGMSRPYKQPGQVYHNK